MDVNLAFLHRLPISSGRPGCTPGSSGPSTRLGRPPGSLGSSCRSVCRSDPHRRDLVIITYKDRGQSAKAQNCSKKIQLTTKPTLMSKS